MANLEHSAVARAAIALASRDASVVPTTVEALTVDSLILPKQHVAVLKVHSAWHACGGDAGRAGSAGGAGSAGSAVSAGSGVSAGSMLACCSCTSWPFLN